MQSKNFVGVQQSGCYNLSMGNNKYNLLPFTLPYMGDEPYEQKKTIYFLWPLVEGASLLHIGSPKVIFGLGYAKSQV